MAQNKRGKNAYEAKDVQIVDSRNMLRDDDEIEETATAAPTPSDDDNDVIEDEDVDLGALTGWTAGTVTNAPERASKSNSGGGYREIRELLRGKSCIRISDLEPEPLNGKDGKQKETADGKPKFSEPGHKITLLDGNSNECRLTTIKTRGLSDRQAGPASPSSQFLHTTVVTMQNGNKSFTLNVDDILKLTDLRSENKQVNGAKGHHGNAG